MPRIPSWILLAALWSAPLRGQLSIRFIDVGQGDAALIRSPAGRNVLVDAGPSPTRVADWLRRAKVDTIHLAIASHNHADHIGGMPQVLDRLVVRNYMENGMVATTRTYAYTPTAQVASITSEGMAVAWDCSQGCGGMPTQPRIVLNTPSGLAL